ncbi:uncharacterized [Tachysurus ichikawai]
MWVKTKEITIQEEESIAAFHFVQPSPARRDCLESAAHVEKASAQSEMAGAGHCEVDGGGWGSGVCTLECSGPLEIT